MNNKTTVCAALALLFTASLSHARWGLDFTASSWEMDAKDLETTKATYIKAVAAANTGLTGISGSIEQKKLSGAASFFIEGNSRVRLGFSAGYGMTPPVSATIHKVQTGAYNDTSVEAKTSYIPVDLYLKFGSKGGGSSFSLGGGAALVEATNDYKFRNDTGTTREEATLTQKKIIPNAHAGFEFFLAKWLSFGLNANYVFNGVLDKMEGDLKTNGVSQGKKRMAMVNDGPGGVNGVKLALKSDGFSYTGNQRPYQYDYSGLRVNAAMRWYFGGGKTTAAKREPVPGQAVETKATPSQPAPAAQAADSEELKMEKAKLELERQKLEFEREKMEFEKQNAAKQ